MTDEILSVSKNDLVNHIGPILRHFMTLDVDDRVLRFFHSMTNECIAEWLNHVINDRAYDQVWILVKRENEVVGIGQMTHCPETTMGELAFTVSPEQRGEGIAHLLFEMLIAEAKEQGLKSLYLSFLTRNRAMRELAIRHGFELSWEGSDVYGTLTL